MLRFSYRQLQPQRVTAVTLPQPSLLVRIVRLLTGTPAPAPESTRGLGGIVGDSARRPFLSVRVQGPVAARRLRYALLDTGSQDTLLPMELAEPLGIVLGGERQAIKWRGHRHWVEFHAVELEITESGTSWRWRARVGFTPAPLSYALLGQRGCLEFLDATFRGADQVAELEMNRLFPGTTRSAT